MGYLYKPDQVENNDLTEAIRAGIRDRGTWFYLLLKAAKEQGGDSDAIAKKAIFEFGKLKGEGLGDVSTPREFFDSISSKNAALAFEMEEVNVEENEGTFRFHHCALCDAWNILGCSQEEINQLCKLSMQGDYGMVSDYPLDLNFKCTIGEGANYCEMVITKKKLGTEGIGE